MGDEQRGAEHLAVAAAQRHEHPCDALPFADEVPHDGLLVVDYKTDGVTDVDDAHRLAQHHRRQGAGYAEALARLTGRPIAGCRFVFCGVDAAIEVDLPDLDDVRAEVVELLERP